MYSLLQKYIKLLEQWEQEQPFLGIDERLEIQMQMHLMEKRLVNWVIKENIDFKTFPRRLYMLIIAQLKHFEKIEDIAQKSENSRHENLSYLAFFGSEMKANFAKPVNEFLAINEIQNENHLSRKETLNKLRMFNLENKQ